MDFMLVVAVKVNCCWAPQLFAVLPVRVCPHATLMIVESQVGSMVGSEVGDGVSTNGNVGSMVGSSEGSFVGSADGSDVGSAEGSIVGSNVGLNEASSDWHVSSSA